MALAGTASQVISVEILCIYGKLCLQKCTFRDKIIDEKNNCFSFAVRFMVNKI